MTKRQIIDEILSINTSAQPAFLATFEQEELSGYLEHLEVALSPRPRMTAERYERYFDFYERVPAQPVQTDEPVEDAEFEDEMPAVEYMLDTSATPDEEDQAAEEEPPPAEAFDDQGESDAALEEEPQEAETAREPVAVAPGGSQEEESPSWLF